MYSRILVPLDGSPVAEAVLTQAVMLAKCGGSEIVLLSVVNHPNVDYYIPDPSMAVTAFMEQQRATKDYLSHVAADLTAQGIRVRIELCEGAVAEAILDYAATTQADLIAMSTHGRSGIGRFLLGSVAEKVIRSAKVPVLLIRPVVRSGII